MGHGNNRQKYTCSDSTTFHLFLIINMVGSHILEALVFLNGWLFDAPIADGNNHKGGTATIADGNNQLDGAPKVLLLQLLTAATVKVDHMFLLLKGTATVKVDHTCSWMHNAFTFLLLRGTIIHWAPMFLNKWFIDVPTADKNNHKGGSTVSEYQMLHNPTVEGNNRVEGDPMFLNK